MWRYVLIFLAVQSACAAPMLSCVELKYFIINELDQLNKETLVQLSELLKQIIDETDIADVSDKDREKFKGFVKIIENSIHFRDYDDPMFLFEEMDGITDFLDHIESNESDDSLPRRLLKYGMSSFKQNMNKLTIDSLRRIEKHVTAYLNNIRGDKSMELKWNNWITNLKSETDTETKLTLLDEFWDSLDC